MKCPKCKKKIGLAKQIKEWDESYGNDVAGEAIVNIWCDNCEDMMIMVSIYGDLVEELIESPALKSKVSLKMPKWMRKN
jgi:hypothetical protein